MGAIVDCMQGAAQLRTYDRLVERYEGYSERWGLAILRRLTRRRRA
jgi:hypothetical protein